VGTGSPLVKPVSRSALSQNRFVAELPTPAGPVCEKATSARDSNHKNVKHLLNAIGLLLLDIDKK
jgi:hypothetical protein